MFEALDLAYLIITELEDVCEMYVEPLTSVFYLELE